jgi:hypothetical protein
MPELYGTQLITSDFYFPLEEAGAQAAWAATILLRLSASMLLATPKSPSYQQSWKSAKCLRRRYLCTISYGHKFTCDICCHGMSNGYHHLIFIEPEIMVLNQNNDFHLPFSAFRTHLADGIKDLSPGRVLALLILLYVGSWALVYIYRITLHPLAHIPGPKLAGMTFWYEFYYDVYPNGGQYLWQINRLHEKYGRSRRENTIARLLMGQAPSSGPIHGMCTLRIRPSTIQYTLAPPNRDGKTAGTIIRKSVVAVTVPLDPENVTDAAPGQEGTVPQLHVRYR